MRVAVVHDWLTGMRGGEKVLEGILDLHPEAELFTLFHFPGTVSSKIEARPIRTSFLQGPAERAGDYRRLLPFFPMAVGRWSFEDYDLLISSSHCVAKGVRSRRAPHISYCHTPMRYIWDRFDDYFPAGRPALRFAATTVAPFLRQWDRRTSSNVDLFVANSAFVRERIGRYYRRDASIVHPFVDDAYVEAPLVDRREDYHLIVSALVPYKRIELAIEAAEASGRKIVLVGKGPLEARFRSAAGPNVEFAGFVSDEDLIGMYGRARSLILPGVEDFGITCLEAMAVGTPVVALRAGGSLDSVVEGETGIFFDRPNVEDVVDALDRVERHSWNREALRRHAARFSRERFLREFSAVVDSLGVPQQ